MKSKFHHVALKSHDFDRSVHFYSEVLGFKKSLEWGEGDERAIMLDFGDGSYLEIFAGGEKPQESNHSIIHIAVEVDSCDDYFNKSIAFGCKSKMDPKDFTIPAKSGDVPVRIAFIYGPDNEEVEFFQNK